MPPKATIIYPPGEVYFDPDTGYRYCKLAVDNRRRVHVLLEPGDPTYTQYQVVGGVNQSAEDWNDLPASAADGEYIVPMTLAPRGQLLTSEGPWALDEGAQLSVVTLDAAGKRVQETYTALAADFADMSMATADELAASMTMQLIGVTAKVTAGRVALTTVAANQNGFIQASAPDGFGLDEVLGLSDDNATTCYYVAQEAKGEPTFRGFSGQTKKVYIRFRAGEDGTTSDWCEDWVVFDTVVPLLPKTVRNLLGFGIPLIRVDGIPFPDEDLFKLCLAAISEMETFLFVFLTPTRIMTCPQLRTPVPLARFDYDVNTDAYDWNIKDAVNWFYIPLRHYPIIGTPKMQLVYIGGSPVVEIPQAWLKVYHRTGQIQITPGGTGMVNFSIGLGGNYLPLTGIGLHASIPQYIWFDYTAGFDRGQVPAVVWQNVAKLAAVSLFQVASDAQELGTTNRSLSDGVISQSQGLTASGENPLLGARIKQYKEELARFEKQYQGKFRRPKFTVI